MKFEERTNGEKKIARKIVDGGSRWRTAGVSVREGGGLEAPSAPFLILAYYFLFFRCVSRCMFSVASVEPFVLLVLLMLPHRWLHGIRAHRWTTRWKEQHEHTHKKGHGKYHAANARNNEMWIFSSPSTLFMSLPMCSACMCRIDVEFSVLPYSFTYFFFCFPFFFRVWCYCVLVFSFDISCWFRANDSLSLPLSVSMANERVQI